MKVKDLLNQLGTINPEAELATWDNGVLYPCTLDMGHPTLDIAIVYLWQSPQLLSEMLQERENRSYNESPGFNR